MLFDEQDFVNATPFLKGLWHAPKLLDRLKCESEMKNDERAKSRGKFFGS
jgi:hypothetical protein